VDTALLLFKSAPFGPLRGCSLINVDRAIAFPLFFPSPPPQKSFLGYLSPPLSGGRFSALTILSFFPILLQASLFVLLAGRRSHPCFNLSPPLTPTSYPCENHPLFAHLSTPPSPFFSKVWGTVSLFRLLNSFLFRFQTAFFKKLFPRKLCFFRPVSQICGWARLRGESLTLISVLIIPSASTSALSLQDRSDALLSPSTLIPSLHPFRCFSKPVFISLNYHHLPLFSCFLGPPSFF